MPLRELSSRRTGKCRGIDLQTNLAQSERRKQRISAAENVPVLPGRLTARREEGPFEPLKESTLRGRAHMGGEIGKAAIFELDSRAAGNEPDPGNVCPLNATGQMRNAVNYVIRKD